MKHLFITGAYRSGTTLVDKVVTSFPGSSIASQPFPNLLPEVKKSFPRFVPSSLDPYPLGNLFLGMSYSRTELTSYLSTLELAESDIHAWANGLRDYSGHLTPELFDVLDQVHGGSVSDSLQQTSLAIAKHFGKVESISLVGLKEILSEEFVPYLDSAGWQTLIVVRDPRAMLRSLNLGIGHVYGGGHRPTLFHLRNWRKSVAFALGMKGSERSMTIRYEDLVGAPAQWINKLGRFLNVSAAKETSLERLRDQSGDWWQGNSSFDSGVNRDPVGWERVDEYIERVCGPEMVAMGYLESCPELRQSDLVEFIEPVHVSHRDFSENWGLGDRQIDSELTRRTIIEEGIENESFLVVPGIASMLQGSAVAGVQAFEIGE